MREDLDQYSFSSYSGFNAQLIRWRYDDLKQYFHGKTCLELGSADGQGTHYLLAAFAAVTAVDGSEQAIKDLQERFDSDKLTTVCAYFENLELEDKFDTIVMAHILEHVDNPGAILRIAAKFLQPEGVLIVDVPNGMSVHRQIGVEMGLLETPTQLNDADRSIGHKRVYTPESFRKEITDAGLQVAKFGGLFLKVLSNQQTEQTFDHRQLAAFRTIGRRYPDIASEMFVVAELAE